MGAKRNMKQRLFAVLKSLAVALIHVSTRSQTRGGGNEPRLVIRGVGARFLTLGFSLQSTRLPLLPWKSAVSAFVAGLVLTLNLSVARADFVGPNAITINGIFTDWTGNVYSMADGGTGGKTTSSANDITKFWYAMSTATGTTPASSANLIQNAYFRFDTAYSSSSNPKQSYWVQLNLGTAPPGLADHILQFYVDTSATPQVTIVFYQYNTPYPAIGAFTTGAITAKVINVSGVNGFTGVPVDTSATGFWAT